MSEDLRYPIGVHRSPSIVSKTERDEANRDLGDAASAVARCRRRHVRGAVEHAYRNGGWTVRQLVHHIADSHMNAFIRVKLALTEDWPTIKVYDEKEWAALADSTAPIEWSLDLVANLHARWVTLLRSLDEAQWQRGFVHPERGRSTLEQATLLYQWHSKHHLAHLVHLRTRMNW